MRVLETDRLVLKPVEETDLQYLLDLRWDAGIVNYLIHEPLSYSDQIKWFNGLTKKDMPLLLWVKQEDGALERGGTIGLYNINQRHQTAIWKLRIDDKFQNKGFAVESAVMVFTYGFENLNLNKITGTLFADNPGTVKMHKKLGFTNEGLLREHYYHQGSFKDCVYVGLLKRDFDKERAISYVKR